MMIRMMMLNDDVDEAAPIQPPAGSTLAANRPSSRQSIQGKSRVKIKEPDRFDAAPSDDGDDNDAQRMILTRNSSSTRVSCFDLIL